MASPTRQNRVKERDPKRVGSAILSVLMAATIWFVISMRQNWTIEQNVKTSLVNVPDDVAPTSALPDSVSAELSGPGWALLPIHLEPLSINIDAPAEGGEVRLNQQLAEGMPPGVNLVSLSVERVQVDLDERITKRVPVKLLANLRTTNPEYALRGKATLSPDSVSISGARSILEQLEEWPTEFYRNEELGTTGQTVTIALSDSLASVLECDIEEVDLVMQVSQFTEVVRILKVEMEGDEETGSKYRFQPDQVRVRFQVPIDQYERAGQAYFKVFVTQEAIDRDFGTGIVRLNYDRSQDLIINNLRMDPDRIEFYEIQEE